MVCDSMYLLCFYHATYAFKIVGSNLLESVCLYFEFFIILFAEILKRMYPGFYL